ncbi:MAG TPA: PhnD/SsuA/transferrin family substrate-binding protein [Gemmataceae bacterium]|nr:PhnD/SsuA/transferrin family substrate-binding protein [Gemmataceae bacterium]
MVSRTLRFATFLAPNMLPVYRLIARHVQARLDIPTELVVGSSYERLSEQAEVSFLCGLAYIELRRLGEPIEPLAAPLLRGGRYGGRPVYFSDVIVRRDSPFRSFADLRGCSWAYNEPYSHSGPGITCYRLVELRETQDYFGRVIEAGWHQRSIRLVQRGEVDASAVDSHVLALARRDHPELDRDLRVIDSLGPSTIQPVVVVSWLEESLKADLRSVLLEMTADRAARAALADRLVERFVAIADEDYDDLRRMRAACVAAELPTLRPRGVAC